jgi:hypothetical protein
VQLGVSHVFYHAVSQKPNSDTCAGVLVPPRTEGPCTNLSNYVTVTKRGEQQSGTGLPADRCAAPRTACLSYSLRTYCVRCHSGRANNKLRNVSPVNPFRTKAECKYCPMYETALSLEGTYIYHGRSEGSIDLL